MRYSRATVPVVWPQPRRIAVEFPANVLVKPSAGRVTGVTLDGIGLSNLRIARLCNCKITQRRRLTAARIIRICR